MHLKVTGHIPPWRMAVHEEVVKRAWLHHAVLTCSRKDPPGDPSYSPASWLAMLLIWPCLLPPWPLQPSEVFWLVATEASGTSDPHIQVP